MEPSLVGCLHLMHLAILSNSRNLAILNKVMANLKDILKIHHLTLVSNNHLLNNHSHLNQELQGVSGKGKRSEFAMSTGFDKVTTGVIWKGSK